MVEINSQVNQADPAKEVTRQVVNYFAYGSNMDVGRMQERKVAFDKVEPATLAGYRLTFNKQSQKNPNMGFANVMKSQESEEVQGVVYTLAGNELTKLDKHEGYPKHYSKITVPVKVRSGEEIEAVMYVANEDKIVEGLKPSREYLSHLLAGVDFVSDDYRAKLEQIATID